MMKKVSAPNSGMVGLVLAGGLSRRFGRDKALAPCADGRPHLVQAVELMRSLSCLDAVAVSCRKEQEAEFRKILPPSALLVPDEEGGTPTPLRGILAALKFFDRPLLTIPCDLPYMRADLLLRLVLARNEAARQGAEFLRTSFVHPDGVIEGLIAVYEAACLPAVQDALCSGRLGLYSLVPRERQVLVESAEELAFGNRNTLEDPLTALGKPRKPWC